MPSQPPIDKPYYSAKALCRDEIPVIDVAGLMSGDAAARAQVATHIVKASREIGFFYIKGHGIPEAVTHRATATMRQYFALPAEIKARQSVNRSQRGWMASGIAKLEGAKTHDLKEIFFWGPEKWADRFAASAGNESLIAENTWPSAEVTSLKADLLPYYDAAQDIARKLLSAIAVGLNQDAAFFESFYTSPLARGQLVYYPVSAAADEAAERFGSAPHTDFGVLTLLLQDANGGLQVRNLQGEWVEAQPIDGTLVCNIGDLLNRWTHRYLSSNAHRVINRSGRERHSLVLFFDPDPDAVIDPGDLGFPEGRAEYPPVSTAEYIHGKNRRNFGHYAQVERPTKSSE